MCIANSMYTVIDCGPPPLADNCTATATTTGCGSDAAYSPIDSATIRIFGDTTLTCGTDGQWQVDPGQMFPFCIPSEILVQGRTYHRCEPPSGDIMQAIAS